ncbi:MAG: ankyrin repeat domain-containing protein [Alphaproteobacteria bacterium]|nr:ankyrin repeat domain-containing protein [Alphaproteobacteria bacterium]
MNTKKWIVGCSIFALLYASEAVAVGISFKQNNIFDSNGRSEPRSAEVRSTSETEIYNGKDDLSDEEWFSDAEDDAFFSDSEFSTNLLTREQGVEYEKVLRERGLLDENEHLPSNMNKNEILDIIEEANEAGAQESNSNQKKKKYKGKAVLVNESSNRKNSDFSSSDSDISNKVFVVKESKKKAESSASTSNIIEESYNQESSDFSSSDDDEAYKVKKSKGKTTFINESYVPSYSDSSDVSSSSSSRPSQRKTTFVNETYYGDSDSDSSSCSSSNRYQTKFDSSKVLESQKAHQDLFKYIEKKDVEGIKKLLILKGALNKWNDKGQPALVMYAREGNLEMVKWLIENFKENLDINAKDYKGDTALIDAAFKGHYDIVKYLVENGADINIQGENESTALINSIWDKNKNEVTHLLLNQPDIKLDLKGQDGKTALFWAVDTENTDMVERLINMEADSNIADDKGNTPLMIAVNRGYNNVVKLLVESGADVTKLDANGNTILINAIKYKNNEIINFLLDQPSIKLNVKGQYGKTALYWAVDNNNLKITDKLIERGANYKIIDDKGNTLLMIAVQKGYDEIAKLLMPLPNNTNEIISLLTTHKNKQALTNGQIADSMQAILGLGKENDRGSTALLLAFDNENWPIMNLLLEHGAKIPPFTKDYMDMLEKAVKSYKDASFDVVKRLLKFRKNFDDKNFGDPKFGIELLRCAIEQENFDKAWLLIEKGADLNGLKKTFAGNELYKLLQKIHLALKSKTNVDIKDKNGYTALNGLKKTFAGNELYKLLQKIHLALKSKTNVDIKDEDGETPLLSVLNDKRIRRVKYDLVKRLLESGANVNASSGRGITALHLAVLQGYAEIAELLIEHGANVNASDDNGDTALLSVLKNKRILVILLMHDLVKLLLKFDADVKASNDRGITALHLAAQEGYAEIAELLIKHGANVNAESEDGRTPLFFAENVKTAELLIEHGADIYWKNRNGDTALLSVLKNERIQIEKYYLVKRLLKSGADVNASNRGITALHLAAQEGYVEIAELLIKYGANVNASDDNGNTALLFAFNNKNLEIMNLLLDHGAKIDSINVVFPNMLKWAVESKDDASFDTVKRLLRFRKNFDDKSFSDPEFGRELLECAIKQENFDKIWLLIEKGADLNGLKRKYEHNAWYKYLQRIYSVVKSETNVDIKDENGNTVLQSVLKDKKIRRVKYDLVERLLESGVDVNVSDGKKNTALHLAVGEGYTEIAGLLIKHRANINAVNEDGWTPLFFAEDVETAQLLVDHGAKVDWKIKDGRNWLVKYLSFGEEIPPEQKKLPMVEFILKKLSRDGINEPNDLGDTALHVTARCNYAKITELLINYGADIHLRNKEGETPLIYTAKYDSEKVARVLLSINENTEKQLSVKKISLEDANEALMIAAENGNEKIVELLLDTRSDISEKQIRNALEKAKEKGGANYLSGYGYRFGKTIEILSERIPESASSASSSDSDSSSSTSPKKKWKIISGNGYFSSSDSDDEPYYLNKSRSNSQETQESSSSSSDNDDDRDTSDSDSSSSTSPKRKREIIIMENLDSLSGDSDDEPYYLNKSRSNSQETQESSSSSSDSETKSHIVYKTKNKGKKPASTNSDSYFSSDY